MMKLLGMTVALASVLAGQRGAAVDKNLTSFWIADFNSIDLHGAGAPINWAAFTDSSFGTPGSRFIPSGYPVMLASGKIVPADGSAGSETLLLRSGANENVLAEGISGYGLVTGGNVYEAYLPTATGNPAQLPSAVRARVSSRIRLQ